ncbi:J domain-containing protein [Aliiruegeria sabulilitoris]|uniref:J domain-containing protein n=1 Tax=Aliiruegeria sabulilitoris TaxID=1510458 RepID=UPI00082E0D09|nr:J domain-containing protein [Aliiruegeria sabulilitoris]NDR58199.1 J domain-containing protein [Pseudoruegeria sp. M32A2M]
MTVRQDFPEARDLGLVPGLSRAELQRVYRQLAREYHPDGGRSGSAEIMLYINTLHDRLKQSLEVGEPPSRPAQPTPPTPAPPRTPKPANRPEKPRPARTPAMERTAPRSRETAIPDSLGELSLTRQARELMSAALIEAVDAWLVCNRGVPRNALRRRMLVRLGRIGPVSCPGLHMPERVSMVPRALRFHFRSSPVEGLNLVALPALSNEGICLHPTGEVSVLEEAFIAGQDRFSVEAGWASAHGFNLAYAGRVLPVELLFRPGESDFSASLFRLPNQRFRGVFSPPGSTP